MTQTRSPGVPLLAAPTGANVVAFLGGNASDITSERIQPQPWQRLGDVTRRVVASLKPTVRDD